MKYRAWSEGSEREEDGREYTAGPGLAAEEHARVAFWSEPFEERRINVRRVGHDEVLVFDVWVEMEPTFNSTLVKGKP